MLGPVNSSAQTRPQLAPGKYSAGGAGEGVEERVGVHSFDGERDGVTNAERVAVPRVRVDVRVTVAGFLVGVRVKDRVGEALKDAFLVAVMRRCSVRVRDDEAFTLERVGVKGMRFKVGVETRWRDGVAAAHASCK